jgi:sugar phosphate isomerase/epimerase
MITRRTLLSVTAAAPLLRAAKRVPVGLEMYSVRKPLEKDLEDSIRRVAKMGYQVMEFYNYYDWTPEKAKEIRKLLDDLNVACSSTHNSEKAFEPDGIQRAIDLNGILGSRFVVMASAGTVKGLDGWKNVADKLTKASERLASAKLRAGYHNHTTEFTPLDGKRPIDVIAQNTPKNVMLQLDAGHCVAGGGDPVAFIDANPGRVNSLHLKDWSPDKKYETIFGEGILPWKKIFAAAEKSGGVEFYLTEFEGQEQTPYGAVEQCLANFKKLHG